MQYPADLPIDEIKEVISIIRTHSLSASREKFAKDVWILAGYALSKSIGEEQGYSAEAPFDDNQACQMLESAVSSHAQSPLASQALPWGKIAAWAIKLLMQAL